MDSGFISHDPTVRSHDMDQWSRLTTRPCIDLMRVAAALCPAPPCTA
jgi:hypothetical protein